MDIAAFYELAFQSGAFQTEAATEEWAFQQCAFQADAFQADACQPEVTPTVVGGVSGGGGPGGKLSRKPGWFGGQTKPREGFQHDVDYDRFREQVLTPVDIEADDEEVLMLLVQMVGEL